MVLFLFSKYGNILGFDLNACGDYCHTFPSIRIFFCNGESADFPHMTDRKQPPGNTKRFQTILQVTPASNFFICKLWR